MNQSTLIPVSFREATLFVVDHEGQPFVPMKPVVEGMGLSWQGQHEKLKSNQERWSIKEILMVAEDGKMREQFCIPLRKINGWLMTISPNKVKPEIKDTIIAYQNECDEVLWQHWNQAKPAPFALPDFTNPAEAARAWALEFDRAETEKQARLASDQKYEEALPKVQFYDQVVYKEPLLDKAQLFSLLKTKTGQTFNEQTFLNFLREIGVAHKVNPYRNIGYKRFVPKSEYIDYWFVAQMGEDGHTEWFYRNIIVADLVTIIEQARHTERSMVQSSMIRRNRAYA